MASDATQAMTLGEFESSQQLLAQATELDPTSADYAYRHARALEEVGDADHALEEYCRALDLNVEELGVLDVRDRIDALYETVRERIPVEARDAFVRGLAHADSSDYQDAAESFTEAIEAAPEWGAPVYNRGIIYENLGRIQESLADYRRYVDLAPTDIDPVLVLVSERIGQLEGAASAGAPNPTGAAVLGLLPGMGQYYTGQPVVGTLTLAGAGGAIAAGLMFKKVTTLCVDEVPAGGRCPDELVHDEITERPYLWYGMGAAAAITLVGAIDAFLDARRLQGEAEALTGTGAQEPSTSGLTVGLPTVESDGARVDVHLLRLRFR